MTVLYAYGLFVIFCLLVLIVMLIETFTGFTKTMKFVYNYVSTGGFYQILNPAVYCSRIREDTTSC